MTRHLALLLLAGCRGCGGSVADTASPGTGDPSAATDSGEITPLPDGCAAVANGGPLDAEVCVEDAPCRWSGDQTYGYFGWAVASGGDLDGDGRDDLAIAAVEQNGTDATGASLAKSGELIVVSGASLDREDGGVLARLSGGAASDALGSAVVMAGDTDGDGTGDLLVGAKGVDVGVDLGAGAAFLLHGGAGAWEDAALTVDSVTSWRGESTDAGVGTALAAAGDTDGDGLADLLLSGELVEEKDEDPYYREGRVYLVLGSEDRSPGARSLALADAAWDGLVYGDATGLALAGGGDLDGDGYDDLVAGAPYARSSSGTVYVIAGGAAPAGGSLSGALAIEGEYANDLFGWRLALGDLSGDGLAELVAAAPLNDQRYSAAGKVTVYSGGAGFFDGTPAPVASLLGEFDDQQLGTGIAAGGDVDGDGVGDLMLGAVNAWRGLVTKGGRVFVFHGPAEGWGLDADASAAPLVIHGAASKDYVGSALATGDLDADGKDDLVIGGAFVNLYGTYDVGTTWLFWAE